MKNCYSYLGLQYIPFLLHIPGQETRLSYMHVHKKSNQNNKLIPLECSTSKRQGDKHTNTRTTLLCSAPCHVIRQLLSSFLLSLMTSQTHIDVAGIVEVAAGIVGQWLEDNTGMIIWGQRLKYKTMHLSS